jgi:hypothetical protein
MARYNYPHHELEADVWWYYMFSLAFYWSLSISQFFDVKRKDFVEMFIHHITTIALLAFSWTCNLFRWVFCVVSRTKHLLKHFWLKNK